MIQIHRWKLGRRPDWFIDRQTQPSSFSHSRPIDNSDKAIIFNKHMALQSWSLHQTCSIFRAFWASNPTSHGFYGLCLHRLRHIDWWKKWDNHPYWQLRQRLPANHAGLTGWAAEDSRHGIQASHWAQQLLASLARFHQTTKPQWSQNLTNFSTSTKHRTNYFSSRPHGLSSF